MGYSVCDPFISEADAEGRKGPRLCTGRLTGPVTRHSHHPAGVAHLNQGRGAAGGGYGSGVGMPRPRALQDGRRNSKSGEGISTPGAPIPSINGAPADGIPIPVAFQRVAHDERKGRHNGYHPAGETIHGMVEGVNG